MREAKKNFALRKNKVDPNLEKSKTHARQRSGSLNDTIDRSEANLIQGQASSIVVGGNFDPEQKEASEKVAAQNLKNDISNALQSIYVKKNLVENRKADIRELMSLNIRARFETEETLLRPLNHEEIEDAEYEIRKLQPVKHMKLANLFPFLRALNLGFLHVHETMQNRIGAEQVDDIENLTNQQRLQNLIRVDPKLIESIE